MKREHCTCGTLPKITFNSAYRLRVGPHVSCTRTSATDGLMDSCNAACNRCTLGPRNLVDWLISDSTWAQTKLIGELHMPNKFRAHDIWPREGRKCDDTIIHGESCKTSEICERRHQHALWVNVACGYVNAAHNQRIPDEVRKQFQQLRTYRRSQIQQLSKQVVPLPCQVVYRAIQFRCALLKLALLLL